MELTVYTSSPSFRRHLAAALAEIPDCRVTHSGEDRRRPVVTDCVHLVHASSCVQLEALLARLAEAAVPIVVASDTPTLRELIALNPSGLRGYCNSYMADIHYHHMLQTVAAGDNWFAPQLLGAMMELALKGSALPSPPSASASPIPMLTPREQEIATAIAEGMSNKAIARQLGITERTVKAHLTHIFEKTDVRDRLELAAKLLRASWSPSVIG